MTYPGGVLTAAEPNPGQRPPASAPQLWRQDGTRLIVNLHPGQRRAWHSARRFVFMLAGTQGGKALALDTPIPTRRGFVPMSDIRLGDWVFSETGEPCRVTYVSPIYYGRPCYRVTFDDGATLVADAEHQWLTSTFHQRKNAARRVMQPNPAWAARPQCQPSPDASVVTTERIRDTLYDDRGAANHAIPMPGAVRYPDACLPIPPYTLGAWLGDGNTSSANLTSADPEILDRIRAEGVAVGEGKECNSGAALGYRLGGLPGRGGDPSLRAATLQARLRAEGLLGSKHIPDAYLHASIPQRFALLQGLMDTDGSCATDGGCEYSTTLDVLADGMMQLLASLGIKARRYRRSTGWRITMTTSAPVFGLSRKAARLPQATRSDTRARFIRSVDPVPSVPVRCIAVDSPSHLYLAGHDYVPTHNTSFGPLWLQREMSLRGPGDYLAVTSTFPLLKLKMLPEFLRLFRDTLRLGDWRASDRVFEVSTAGARRLYGTADPSRIIFGSAHNSESLESATAKAAWLDEVGQDDFRLESWEAITRRLALHQGRVFGGTTLYNLGWIKSQVYDRWISGDPDYDVIQFASTVNPAFPEAEMDRAARTLADWKLAMFYRGVFSRPAGAIYTDYRDTYREAGGHLVRPFALPPSWPRFVGIDFGAVNTALIWIAADPAARVYYAYRESLSGDKTTAQHAAEARTAARGVNVISWHGGSPSEKQQRMDWQAAGVPVQGPWITDVDSGIDRVIALFKADRLFVFDDLRGLRDELGTYARVIGPDGEPLTAIKDKERFHRLDALRYVAQALAVAEGTLMPAVIPAAAPRQWPAGPARVFTARAGPG